MTENKLILVADGSYLELIALVDEGPSIRSDHWWRDHDCGFSNWALTNPKYEDLGQVAEKVDELDGQNQYGAPKDGGRMRPDEEAIK